MTDHLVPYRDPCEVYLRTVARNYATNIDRWIDELGDWPQEWVEAANLSDLGLRLTPEETGRLGDDLMAARSPEEGEPS